MFDGRGARLLALLDKEHAAILTGDFEALGKLSADKELLMAAVEKSGLPTADVQHIRAKANVNAALLKAAIAGVSTARLRLSDLQKAQNSLEVYDAKGQVEQVAQRTRGLERKA